MLEKMDPTSLSRSFGLKQPRHLKPAAVARAPPVQMGEPGIVKIGTRGSPLALAQARDI